jgi:hypothetical protein
VPKAPFNVSSLDYTQTYPEYWIDVPLKQEVMVDDVERIEQVNSKDGNAGHGSTSASQSLDPNHSYYFGPMQVCILPVDFDASEGSS